MWISYTYKLQCIAVYTTVNKYIAERKKVVAVTKINLE